MDTRAPLGVAALLTWMAGFVDAVGFVSFGGIYTANMSGNSVAIGIQFASQHWMEMVRRLWPVAFYLAGLLVGRILIEIGGRERKRSIASVAFLVEVVLLVPVSFVHMAAHNPAVRIEYTSIALLATAMGLQNAALTHFSSLTLHTGFVTGTLVKFAEQLTGLLTQVFDRVRRPGISVPAVVRSIPREKTFRTSVALAGVWVTYVIGAALGALGDFRWNLRALVVPIVCLLGLTIFDLRYPLATQEEREQLGVSS